MTWSAISRSAQLVALLALGSCSYFAPSHWGEVCRSDDIGAHIYASRPSGILAMSNGDVEQAMETGLLLIRADAVDVNVSAVLDRHQGLFGEGTGVYRVRLTPTRSAACEFDLVNAYDPETLEPKEQRFYIETLAACYSAERIGTAYDQYQATANDLTRFTPDYFTRTLNTTDPRGRDNRKIWRVANQVVERATGEVIAEYVWYRSYAGHYNVFCPDWDVSTYPRNVFNWPSPRPLASPEET